MSQQHILSGTRQTDIHTCRSPSMSGLELGGGLSRCKCRGGVAVVVVGVVDGSVDTSLAFPTALGVFL